MFNCSNCSHQIDDSRGTLPPFCPRCGEPTGDSSPFDDDEGSTSPLPPPPPMGAPLPPPPEMGVSLPPPPRSGRGVPSKTLFGMPGLTPDSLAGESSSPARDDGGIAFPTDDDDDGGIAFPSDDDDDGGIAFPSDDDDDDDGGIAFPADDDDDGGIAFPTDDDDDDGSAHAGDDGGIAFPTDDDDDDGGIAFPTDDDDDDDPILAPPPLAPVPRKAPRAVAAPPPIAAPPPRATPKPPPFGGRPKPPPIGGGAKPPPIGGGAKPPPIGGGGAKPPPIGGGGAKPPPISRAKPPIAPPKPSTDPFSSGVFSGDSGTLAADSGILAGDSSVMAAGESATMGKSGVFEVDPFFTGDPEAMPELGSITHGDASQFSQENPAGRSGVREFEFKDEGGQSLELADVGDLHGGSPPPPRPAPAAPAELSRPNYDSNPDFEALDLPSPDKTADLGDLPVPAGAAPDLDLPIGGDPVPLDLPMPAGEARDLDLPMPGGGGTPDLDLPIASDNAVELDLPVGDVSMELDTGLSLDDLPMPADDLPIPASDLPTALDDFPAPLDDFGSGSFDIDALPTSADSLPTPADSLPAAADSLPSAADSLPAAADSLPAAAEILPAPVDLGLDLDLDGKPAELSTSSGEFETDDNPAETPEIPGKAKPGFTLGRRGSPSPTPGKTRIVPIILYSVLGVAVIGAGVFGAMQLGLFGGPDGSNPITDNEGGGEESTPPAQLSERPENVLSKFDQDTPAAYVQAYTLSENDPIGRAEAALLLHYRYGPDPSRLAEAGTILAEHQNASEGHTRRVLGLAKLSQGQIDAALSLLDGDDPRAALYRAWALLAKELVDKAREAAESAAAGRKNDQAAKLAVLQARFAANPDDGLAAMRKALETSPNHLALQETLMRSARDQGQLGEASTLGQQIQPSSVSDTHKAELLRQRAEIAMAQGRSGEAMRLLEQALASDANLLPARIDRIDLWLFNKDLSSARADIELLLRDHATDPRVLKAGARTDLEAGRDGDARERLASLGEAAATDPEALDLLGEADALLMKVDIARVSYAKAREIDPYYIPALEHEIALMLRAQMTSQALELLDERTLTMTEAGAKAVPRGRQALAAVALARARVLRDNDELAKALTASEDAIADNPANNDARLLRTRLLDQLGREEDHEQALIELHERTGGYPGLTEPLGKVLLRKGQLEELEALIGDSLGSPGASREIILTGAALRLAQSRFEEAETLASKVIERDPTDSRAHLLLGRALLGLEDYPRALDEIESAQTREGDAEVELWLGQALEYNGRAVDSLGHYKRALELDPRNSEAAALLGRLYAYQGAAAKAIEILEPVLKQTDAYPYAHLALGLAHKDMGKRKLAIEDFRKAQKLDPSLFEAYYEEGRIHNDQNKHKLAVTALQAGIDTAKDGASERSLIDSYRRLGDSYKQLGRRAEARAALEEYLKLAPPSAAGRREVERLLRDLR